MKENASGKFSNDLRLAATAILAFGIAAGPVVYAAPKPKDKMAGKSNGKIILVTPAQLPELARQSGEAMLLHSTRDGRTILYVEQNGGGRLAIFDVTDPSSIKQQHSAQIDAAGPFNFVSSLSDSEVLVRFREGSGEAALDLRKVWVPAIRTVPGLNLTGQTEKLGDDGLIVTSQTQASAADYQIVETASSRGEGQVFNVKDVREEITSDATGTTFLLTGDGLYLVRRPEVEEESKLHENQMN
jgi:hypothetical protein